jgi:hypothetical protein
MISLREKQVIFHRAVALLIIEAYKRGIEIFINELYRDITKQAELFQKGLTQTLKSKHLSGLAVDLYILKDGKVILDTVKEYYILGEIWESWGGIWGGHFKSFKDVYHFEYSEKLNPPVKKFIMSNP